jgi:hypothetical protein
MTLQKLLFEPTLVRTPLRVVQWWESRRLTFNLIVGAVGIGTVSYVKLLDLVMGGSLSQGPPWWAVALYGVAANLCYTMGWVVENVAERWLQRPIYGLGPALFRHGLVFSVGLTMIPAVVVSIAVVAGKIF